MNSSSARQKRFDAAMAAIAALPADQQVNALVEFFSTVLNDMPLEDLRERRDQLLAHFSNCGCSYDTCTALLEMVDHHVAIRERGAAKKEAEARKTAARTVSASPRGERKANPRTEPVDG